MEALAGMLAMGFLGWILSAGTAAYVGSQRGSGGFVWFILGLVFGPFALIASFASSPDKTCPDCAEPVRETARKCRHCGRELAVMIQRQGR